MAFMNSITGGGSYDSSFANNMTNATNLTLSYDDDGMDGLLLDLTQDAGGMDTGTTMTNGTTAYTFGEDDVNVTGTIDGSMGGVDVVGEDGGGGVRVVVCIKVLSGVVIVDWLRYCHPPNMLNPQAW